MRYQYLLYLVVRDTFPFSINERRRGFLYYKQYKLNNNINYTKKIIRFSEPMFLSLNDTIFKLVEFSEFHYLLTANLRILRKFKLTEIP